MLHISVEHRMRMLAFKWIEMRIELKQLQQKMHQRYEMYEPETKALSHVQRIMDILELYTFGVAFSLEVAGKSFLPKSNPPSVYIVFK